MHKINPASIQSHHMTDATAKHVIPAINALVEKVESLEKELADLKGAGKKPAPKAVRKTPAKKTVKKAAPKTSTKGF